MHAIDLEHGEQVNVLLHLIYSEEVTAHID